MRVRIFKRVVYQKYFNNCFKSKSTEHKLLFPFWWSDKDIARYVFKKESDSNHSSITWIKVCGKEFWRHPALRNSGYDGLLLNYTDYE